MSKLYKEELKAELIILIVLSVIIFLLGGLWNFADVLAINKKEKSVLVEGNNMSESKSLDDFLQKQLEYNRMRLKKYGNDGSMGKCAQSNIHLLEKIIEIKKREEL